LTRRRHVVVGLVGGLALLVAGCTSSASSNSDDPVISPPAGTTSVATATPPAPSTPPPSSIVPSSPPASTPAATTASSSASTSHSRTTAPPVPERSTCTKLGIRVIPGGASVGQEIAALQFTNQGSTRCTLAGYPSVTLLLHGRAIGRPSQPSTTAPSTRALEPGETAESLLHDYVGNCQAPLSDRIRVIAPGSTLNLVRPMQLRACVVRVDKLDAPD
jgi:Protein of unknown function (DUF4232)